MLDRFGQNYNIAQQKKPICSSLSVRRKAQISKIGSTIYILVNYTVQKSPGTVENNDSLVNQYLDTYRS
jgi:hypothetical protein